MEPGNKPEPNWRWLMPVAALILIITIAVVTNKHVSDQKAATTYPQAMVAIGDNGVRGDRTSCGDSVVTYRENTSMNVKLIDVYSDLFEKKSYDFKDGLKNQLYKSNLQVTSADIDADGTAKVVLTGSLDYKDACELDRIKLQLKNTGKGFKGVKKVDIKLNGKALDSFSAS